MTGIAEAATDNVVETPPPPTPPAPEPAPEQVAFQEAEAVASGHVETVGHHSNQLSGMKSAMTEAESLRSSDNPLHWPAQFVSNAASFVNGERAALSDANKAVDTYETALDSYAAQSENAPSLDGLNTLRDDANQAVMEYTTKSIGSDQFTSNAIFGTVDRMAGIPQTGFGAVEVVGGTGLFLAPEPTMATKVAGGVAVVHGVDTTQTGLRRMVFGGEQNTLTHMAASGLASTAGADENTANAIGTGADVIAGLGIPAGLIDDVGRNVNSGMSLAQASWQSGKTAVQNGAHSLSGLWDDTQKAVGDFFADTSDIVTNGDVLFRGSQPLKGTNYLTFQTSNKNVKAVFTPEFRDVYLSDRNFLNDIKQAIKAAEGALSSPQNLAATSGNSISVRRLGSGTEGVVYKIKIADKPPIAVKLRQNNKKFLNYKSPIDQAIVTDRINQNGVLQKLSEANIYENVPVDFALSSRQITSAGYNNDLTTMPFVDGPITKYSGSLGQNIMQKAENLGISIRTDDFIAFMDRTIGKNSPNFVFDDIGENLIERNGKFYNIDPYTIDAGLTNMDDLFSRKNNSNSSWLR